MLPWSWLFVSGYVTTHLSSPTLHHHLLLLLHSRQLSAIAYINSSSWWQMTHDGPIQHALEGSSQEEKKTKEIILNRKIIAASLKILSKTLSSIVFFIYLLLKVIALLCLWGTKILGYLVYASKANTDTLSTYISFFYYSESCEVVIKPHKYSWATLERACEATWWD